MSKSSFTIRETKKVTKKYQKRNLKIGQKNRPEICRLYLGLEVIHTDARGLKLSVQSDLGTNTINHPWKFDSYAFINFWVMSKMVRIGQHGKKKIDGKQSGRPN